MIYKGIANYLEQAFGVTEFWLNGVRFAKTVEGDWIAIK